MSDSDIPNGRYIRDIGQVHWPECNIWCNEEGHWLLERDSPEDQGHGVAKCPVD